VREERPITPSYLGYRNAQPWPLARPIEDVAVQESEAEQYEPGSSRVATGVDAVALRELRTRFLAREIGFEAERFIPIELQDGARFRLYVRDAFDIENEQGLLPWRVTE
jgi:hypothetical protein